MYPIPEDSIYRLLLFSACCEVGTVLGMEDPEMNGTESCHQVSYNLVEEIYK